MRRLPLRDRLGAGSDYIREKVLKTLLRREQELIAGGSAERAELNEANYEFAEPAGSDR